MGEFNKGDLVIGNEKNSYSITAEGVVCKVVNILDDGVILIKHEDYIDEFIVNSDEFDLYAKSIDIEEMTEEDEPMDEFVEDAELSWAKSNNSVVHGSLTLSKPEENRTELTMHTDHDLGVTFIHIDENEEIAESVAYYRLHRQMKKV